MKKQTKIKIRLPYYLKVSILIFVVALSTQIFLSNSFAAKTTDLKDLHLRRGELQKQVSRLEYEDSILSSMSSVESRATELGFLKNNELLASVNIQLPVVLASANIR